MSVIVMNISVFILTFSHKLFNLMTCFMQCEYVYCMYCLSNRYTISTIIRLKNYKFGFQSLHNTSWIILWLHFKTNISCLKIWQYLSMNISAVMNLFTSFSVHLKMIPCCYLIYIIHVVDTVFFVYPDSMI